MHEYVTSTSWYGDGVWEGTDVYVLARNEDEAYAKVADQMRRRYGVTRFDVGSIVVIPPVTRERIVENVQFVEKAGWTAALYIADPYLALNPSKVFCRDDDRIEILAEAIRSVRNQGNDISGWIITSGADRICVEQTRAAASLRIRTMLPILLR
jgi:hypothetical protein